MPTRMGAVSAKSAYGIMLDGKDEWVNYSKPEYRGSPWEADSVVKGDVVQIETDDSGKFIKSICRVSQGQDVTLPGDFGEAPGLAPIEVEPISQWGYREKDKLMLQESCIKSAVTIFAACVTVGLYKQLPTSEVILAYSQALAKHAMEQV